MNKLNEKIKVLDHGYVQLVEHWGSDSRIIEAARMSTDKGFLGWGPITKCQKCGVDEHPHKPGSNEPHPYKTLEQMRCEHEFETKPGDEKLLKYLYEHKHATPFEMAGVVFEIQAPIMVFREWHRHRSQSYNEMSGRYIALPNLNYVPTVERLMMNSKTNKQAGTIKGADELTEDGAKAFILDLEVEYRSQEEFYQRSLKMGVPKEIARVHIGVGRYSRMRAQANLRNWLAFLTLRMAPDAQWEIRQYANIVGDYLKELFPRTWELFVEGRTKK